MPTHNINYSEEKLAELVVYVSSKCEAHARFGATKLNKILFYADFMSYRWRGKPITGAEYQKLPRGPAPVRLLPVASDLVACGAVVRREMLAPGGYKEKRLIPLRAANLKVFDAEEISLVDEIIEALKDHTASEVSEASHRMPGWMFAEDRENIPYFTAVLPERVPPLSTADSDWAKRAISRFVAG